MMTDNPLRVDQMNNEQPHTPSKPSSPDVLQRAGMYIQLIEQRWFIPLLFLVAALLIGFLAKFTSGILFILIIVLIHILFFALTIGMILYALSTFVVRRDDTSNTLPVKPFIAMGLAVLAAILWVIFGSFFIARGERDAGQAEKIMPLAVRMRNVETNRWDDVRDLNNLSAPVELQFDSRATVPSQTPYYKITSYSWDLDGDGVFSDVEGHDAIATYLYTDRGVKNGIFDVSLKVTKEILQPYGSYKTIGETVEETYGPGSTKGGLTFQITTVRPLIDVRTVPSTLKGTVPFEVEFDARRTRSEADLKEITWDFTGDKVPDATGDDVKYTFNKPGIYEVLVEAVDVEGKSSKKIIEVEVGDTLLPDVKIKADPLSGEAPLKVTLDGSDSTSQEGDITDYSWTIEGRSEPLRGKKVEYTFKEAGKYNVTLEVKTDAGVSATASEVIDVSVSKSSPTSRIKATGRAGNKQLSVVQGGKVTGPVPFTLKFDGSYATDPDNDIVSYEWDLDGDGKVDKTGEQVEYTYKQAGTYTAALTVEDSVGNRNTSQVTVVVTSEDFSVSIIADQLSGPAPLTVNFDASGSSYALGEILSYTWDFGDGTPSKLTGAKVTHTYRQPGEYVASVKVTTSDNTSKTATQVVTALEPSLLPQFDFTPARGTAPVTVSFDASGSQGDIVSYKWDFGNGKIGTGQHISHTYSVPGVYVITLTVTDSTGGVKKVEKQLTVDQ